MIGVRRTALAAVGACNAGSCGASGYSRWSLVATALDKYTTIIGRGLPARSLSHQKPAAKIGCNVLTRGSSLGVPVSVLLSKTRTSRETEPAFYACTNALTNMTP